MRNWLRRFWFHDTIDAMQARMLRQIPEILIVRFLDNVWADAARG